jgi:hypothetical protein
MSKSIFVIEQGSYSDYRVVGVFSTRENAEMVAEKINAGQTYGDEATVAEWPLDPAVSELNQGMSQFRVLMRKDGHVEECKAQEFDSYDIKPNTREWEREDAIAYRGKDIPNVLQATVWATDEKHAIKIVKEHLFQMLALGQWKGKL